MRVRVHIYYVHVVTIVVQCRRCCCLRRADSLLSYLLPDIVLSRLSDNSLVVTASSPVLFSSYAPAGPTVINFYALIWFTRTRIFV